MEDSNVFFCGTYIKGLFSTGKVLFWTEVLLCET